MDGVVVLTITIPPNRSCLRASASSSFPVAAHILVRHDGQAPHVYVFVALLTRVCMHACTLAIEAAKRGEYNK